jgi:hypothetical protein
MAMVITGMQDPIRIFDPEQDIDHKLARVH